MNMDEHQRTIVSSPHPTWDIPSGPEMAGLRDAIGTSRPWLRNQETGIWDPQFLMSRFLLPWKCIADRTVRIVIEPCPRFESRFESWDPVVHYGVRLTFWPGNYIWCFSYGFGVVVRDLGEWRPGSTQNFAARLVSIVVWPGEPFLTKCPNLKKCTLDMSKKSRNCNFSGTKAPQGASRHKGAFQNQKMKI